ncbi:MAG: VOC family protein [Acidobacteria bacterium]|nr:VOC family protein [Acidobacteriota bacterium]
MLDHVVLNVKDIEKSRLFYEKALAPLGYEVVAVFPGFVGLGIGGKPDLWLARREPFHTKVHVAISCAKRSLVDEFYRVAMTTGGTDNGAPGVRTMYHPNYYGAFVFDPDGNNIEAVCHLPQGK